ncbi:MAG TPA: hypothetical protein VJ875_11375 [Pyrinomonadaceae bacterium]|nr:hypothetical protein [Pyrinomonadaceae bacterium]
MAEPTDPSKPEVIKTLFGEVLADPEVRRNLGKRTTYLILATAAIATVELTYGLPIITLASTPLVGAVVVFLIGSVEDWIRSGKPKTIFYLCPAERKFQTIKWTDLAQYRKVKSCPSCGHEYIKRCQVGKHFIVSPDFKNPEGAPPDINGVCPYCDPRFPVEKRRYLPEEFLSFPPI